jgi:hypothetical protein
MAYYIFQKSLRSQEEFRKNHHVKIPPKSRSTNFQSLGKFKNPIFNLKTFFFAFGPADPAARSASCPASPPAVPFPAGRNSPGRPIQPAHRSRLRGKYVFLFGSCLPEPAASPSSLCQPGPTCQNQPLPRTGRPRSEFLRAATPLHRCPAPRMPPSFYSPPSSLSPLNPLQIER